LKTEPKLDQLILDLNSNKLATALAAVKQLKHDGTSKAIKPLIDTWISNESNRLGDAIQKLMYSLKDTEGISTIIDEAAAIVDQEMQAKLLSSLWNAGIDCSDYLETIVNIAVKADYLTAVECMTIIENMEGPFEESQLMESLINLRLIVQDEKDNQAIYKVLLNFLERTEREQ
jgi:hypothetical protein